MKIDITSTTVWSGNPMFKRKYAGHSGGAVGIIMASLVSRRGQIGNSESVGIVNKHRMALWDGVAYLVNNTVFILLRGVLCVSTVSNVSWNGETRFVYNTTGHVRGVLYFAWASNVSWNGGDVPRKQHVVCFLGITCFVGWGCLLYTSDAADE